MKYPLDINVHPDILREVNERISMMQQDQLTWNGAEFLVFSSLLEVKISFQYFNIRVGDRNVI